MFFTYFSFTNNIVKFQTCSWLQNYVIAAYKTIHLPHFLICAKSASQLRIASVCVLQKKELLLCVCYRRKNCFCVCVTEERIASVCVLQKKELLLCVCCVCVCVCYIWLFFSPFSVSIEVERGGGRGGEDLQ